MSCGGRPVLLDAYFDGELDLVEALAVEEHLQGCARCSETFARLRALREGLQGRVPMEDAPAALGARIRASLAPRDAGAGPGWRWKLAWASPGIAALALAAWLALSPQAMPEPSRSVRIVYHVSSATTARDALRNLGNHLRAAPSANIIVVAHNDGVDFLLRGALDAAGQPFEPDVRGFLDRGVQFRVCGNTLERRGIAAAELIPSAALVPSGIAEIGRLQSLEGYAYMRL